METKELKINVPEGYEIDKEKSTFEKIVFKKVEKQLTYEDVAEKLFKDKTVYSIYDEVIDCFECFNGFSFYNNCVSEAQAKWLIALNRLQNVAIYLNDGWNPDWGNIQENKYLIYYDTISSRLYVSSTCLLKFGLIYFKSEKSAKQAIKILGEETIKTALGVYKN